MKLILVSLLLCLAAAPALARRPARCQVTNTPLHLYNLDTVHKSYQCCK